MNQEELGFRDEIEAESTRVIDELRDHVIETRRLAVVKAPPGSGKTYLLLQAAEAAVAAGQRVAIATQTNAQSDDICRRLATHHSRVPTFRFAGGGRAPRALGRSVAWITKTDELSSGPSATVGTTAKWSTIDLPSPLDILLVDEAWQMGWADFMLLGQVSERFVLIGDPGQIPPVVSVSVDRWETSPRAPHVPAPEIILSDPELTSMLLHLQLPACRRLPNDSVDVVQKFYDFEFQAWALAGERRYLPNSNGWSDLDPVLDQLTDRSFAAHLIDTPSEGPPLELDEEVASLAADVAVRMLDRTGKIDIGDGSPRDLASGDIGIAATHRVMNSAIQSALPAGLRNDVRVTTPERWQGLERPIMIIVHPLSGVIHLSEFDLETGRLCVMASRHQVGAIVLSRDHVLSTLDNFIPSAEQAIGRADVAGRGLHQHVGFLNTILEGKS